MSISETVITKLSDVQHGQEAVCFAALARKETGVDRHGNPFMKCHFRDKRMTLVTPLWSSNAYLSLANNWAVGEAFRIRVRGEHNVRYGMQLELLEIRSVTPEDAEEGYDYHDLVDSSDYSVDFLFSRIMHFVEKDIQELPLRQLVTLILEEHKEMFLKMPAAQLIHHSYTAGLAEHVWSMTRIAVFLADHYKRYYHGLNPPLNKGVIVAAAILHDIGKLKELQYHPVEAKYTVLGRLVGHVLLGRDLVRDVAKRIDGLSEETLLLLEHAILSHHGREEFGAPKAPQTIEALIVHYADELDSKVNAVVGHRMKPSEEPFTEKIFALNNRQFYRGVPLEEDDAAEPAEPAF